MMQEPFLNKLLNYEVSPPAAAWDAISDELASSNELLPVSKKLFDYEVTPPADAWTFISSTLATHTESPHSTGATKLGVPWYKMVAAAAILGMVIAGGLYLSHLNLSDHSLAVTQTYKPGEKQANSEPNATASAPLPDDVSISDVSAQDIEAPKPRRYAATNGKELRNTKIQQAIFPESDLEIMITAKPIRNANGEIIQNTQIADQEDNHYISITGPNGQQTKISSKFLDMLLFINDDSDIDQVDGYFDNNFLENLVWKSRFQDWRNKIMNTSLVPSSTNFMDILEFKDLIANDKQ